MINAWQKRAPQYPKYCPLARSAYPVLFVRRNLAKTAKQLRAYLQLFILRDSKHPLLADKTNKRWKAANKFEI
jgi:hypothetical protein